MKDNTYDMTSPWITVWAFSLSLAHTLSFTHNRVLAVVIALLALLVALALRVARLGRRLGLNLSRAFALLVALYWYTVVLASFVLSLRLVALLLIALPLRLASALALV